MQVSDLFNVLQKWLNVSLVIVGQYVLFTGIAYGFFYVWRKRKSWAAKIQQRYPENKHVFREIRYSIYTLMILTGYMTFIVWANKHHLTLVYSPIDKYGWGYYFLSIVLIVILSDTYFYWIHRALHWGPIFKYAHKTHHLSTNPTPFAAYAFHPIEGVLQIGFLPLILFIVPHHITVVSIYGCYTLFFNVLGHSGYEIFPKKMVRHKILKWHNTVTHHNMHHTNLKYNFSLFFNYWDRLMGTNDPNYEDQFEKVVDRRIQAKVKNTGLIVVETELEDKPKSEAEIPAAI